MKKRSKLRVLGQWVELQHVDLSTSDDDGTALLGDCDSDRRIIRIDESLEGEEYQRVLRHEVFHMKLRLSGLKELVADDVEEALAVLMEIKD
jgi:hypothetical protein